MGTEFVNKLSSMPGFNYHLPQSVLSDVGRFEIATARSIKVADTEAATVICAAACA